VDAVLHGLGVAVLRRVGLLERKGGNHGGHRLSVGVLPGNLDKGMMKKRRR